MDKTGGVVKNRKKREENKMPELKGSMYLISNIPRLSNCKGYAVDREGVVYSCKAANWTGYCYSSFWSAIKQKISKSGYPFVIMSNFGSDITITVHRLVAEAFINMPNLECEVNHMDGDKLNNKVENLEWVSHKENILHCISNNLRNTAKGESLPNSILKETDIYNIFLLRSRGLTHREIACIYNINQSVITRVLNGKSWKHITATLSQNATDADIHNRNV